MCEKLRHRFEEEFSSFKVTIPKRFVNNLFNEKVWPKKTVVDYFKQRGPRRRENNYNSGARRFTDRRHQNRRHRDDRDFYKYHTSEQYQESTDKCDDFYEYDRI